MEVILLSILGTSIDIMLRKELKEYIENTIKIIAKGHVVSMVLDGELMPDGQLRLTLQQSITNVIHNLSDPAIVNFMFQELLHAMREIFDDPKFAEMIEALIEDSIKHNVDITEWTSESFPLL